ncbi:MAG TPA: hypothetical protein VLI67_09135, partial [Vicinamibacteria bacterium]|nr:hypothetical protein [Vicinamibacteria bacterium]
LGRRGGFSRPASLAGAAAWLFAPYVALDLFVRAAFAEASAVAVAPLALLGVLRATDRPSLARTAGGGLAVALVPLAHNAAALLLLPALALVAAASARQAPRPLVSLSAGGAVLASGLGLSAFFWLPALVEKEFVRTDLLREGFLRWVEHFVEPRQLLWSAWGYGTSGPGSADGMSFAPGLLHLLLAAGGAALVLRSDRGRRRAETAAFAAAALGGAWLATAWSSGVWSSAETLQYLAYPWRALLLPALFLPLLALPCLEILGRRPRVLATGALVLVNLAHTEPKGYLAFDDEYYAPASIAQRGINTTTREEYTPRWVEVPPPYTADRVAGRGVAIEVAEQRLLSARQEFTLRAPSATELEAATFYYPGWTVEVDGREIEPKPVPVRGTMAFAVGGGEQRVVLELRPTRLRRLSSGLSLGTAALLAASLAMGWAVGRRRAAERP